MLVFELAAADFIDHTSCKRESDVPFKFLNFANLYIYDHFHFVILSFRKKMNSFTMKIMKA